MTPYIEMSDAQDLRRRLRELRAEMKRRGIRRMSMMNGGHTSESMRFNEECFRLETLLKREMAK